MSADLDFEAVRGRLAEHLSRNPAQLERYTKTIADATASVLNDGGIETVVTFHALDACLLGGAMFRDIFETVGKLDRLKSAASTDKYGEVCFELTNGSLLRLRIAP